MRALHRTTRCLAGLQKTDEALHWHLRRRALQFWIDDPAEIDFGAYRSPFTDCINPESSSSWRASLSERLMPRSSSRARTSFHGNRDPGAIRGVMVFANAILNATCSIAWPASAPTNVNRSDSLVTILPSSSWLITEQGGKEGLDGRQIRRGKASISWVGVRDTEREEDFSSSERIEISDVYLSGAGDIWRNVSHSSASFGFQTSPSFSLARSRIATDKRCTNSARPLCLSG